MYQMSKDNTCIRYQQDLYRKRNQTNGTFHPRRRLVYYRVGWSFSNRTTFLSRVECAATMMECLDYEQRLKICEGLLRPQHRTDDKRSSSCRCIYLMLTWCVLSTLLLAASSGYILYGFIRIDGPLGDRHWWRFYDGHERLVGPDRASWCFWNRSKETGRIIVNSVREGVSE